MDTTARTATFAARLVHAETALVIASRARVTVLWATGTLAAQRSVRVRRKPRARCMGRAPPPTALVCVIDRPPKAIGTERLVNPAIRTIEVKTAVFRVRLVPTGSHAAAEARASTESVTSVRPLRVKPTCVWCAAQHAMSRTEVVLDSAPFQRVLQATGALPVAARCVLGPPRGRRRECATRQESAMTSMAPASVWKDSLARTAPRPAVQCRKWVTFCGPAVVEARATKEERATAPRAMLEQLVS